MAVGDTFRIYPDEEVMLKVYGRRLIMADRKWDRFEPERTRFIERYDNEVEDDQLTSRGHRVGVTKGIGVIDTMYSSMTAVDIEFIIQNVGHGTRFQALAAERALNQGWHDSSAQENSWEAIKEALLVDTGWVKVYYDYVEDIELRDRPDEAIEAQVMELFGEHPDMAPEDISDLVDVVEAVTIVLRDRVCVDYVSWEDIRVDPSAKRINDARWVAQYTRMPIEEVRQHPVWRPFVLDRYGERKGQNRLDDLSGDSSVLSMVEGDYADVEAIGRDEYDDDVRVTVVEMWDLETGVVTTFPKGSAETVLFQRLNPLMFNLDLQDRNPFKPLMVRDTPSRFDGNGDMRIIKPALEELDEYRRDIAEYVEGAKPKYAGPERAMTTRGMKALKSQEPFEYIGLQEGFVRNEIGALDMPQLPEVAFQMPERVAAELDESTGLNEVLRGLFPGGRKTATEVNTVANQGDVRQAERRSRLERWYLRIAKTMLQLMQIYYDRDRMLRYTDDLGQEFEWTWNAEDIAIDADLRISLTPRENLTRDQRVQRAYKVVNLLMPLPETDRGMLMRWFLTELGLRDDTTRSMVKTDTEVAAEQQQQAIAQQLAVRPQPFPNSPAGLNIAPAGGG